MATSAIMLMLLFKMSWLKIAASKGLADVEAVDVSGRQRFARGVSGAINAIRRLSRRSGSAVDHSYSADGS